MGKSIKGFLKSNGAKLASKLDDYLPNSSGMLGDTIEKFAISVPVNQELAHPSQLAANRATSFVEDLVHANLVQVLTSACERSKLSEEPGDGLFGFLKI